MANIDFTDVGEPWTVECFMVDPRDPDSVRGKLEGFTGGTITEGYYTDTRVSGSIDLVGGNYVRNSRVRVVASKGGYREELGTFYVTDDAATLQDGAWKTTLTLNSTLYGLSKDIAERAVTYGGGTWCMDAVQDIMNLTGTAYIRSSKRDRMITSPVSMDGGKSYLSRVFALTKSDMANNRVDVDGHGRIVTMPYEPPSSRTATFEIRFDDQRGMAQDGIKRTSTWNQAPGRFIVAYKNGDSETVASYDVSGHASSGERGYMLANYYTVNSQDGYTWQQLYDMARHYAAVNDSDGAEFELSVAYMGLHEGDVGNIVLPSGDGDAGYSGKLKVLVKSVDISLPDMTEKLVLKTASSYFENDDSGDY